MIHLVLRLLKVAETFESQVDMVNNFTVTSDKNHVDGLCQPTYVQSYFLIVEMNVVTFEYDVVQRFPVPIFVFIRLLIDVKKILEEFKNGERS